MKKNWILLPLLGMACVSCGKLNQTIQAIEANNEAINMSTNAIYANIQALQQAGQAIAENQKQIDAVNQTLKHVGEE